MRPEIFILLELALALVCGVLLIAGTILMVSRSRRNKPASPPSPQPPLSQPPPVVVSGVPKKCPQCQAPLAATAPEGLCPACLAKVALGTEPATPGATINVSPLAEAAPGTRVPPKPTELAAQFPQLEILELLGMGGMGMVYKARQTKLDRFVALKILPIDSSRGAVFAERFEREARALAKLNHPGIVTLHDFGQTQEYYYFIMEFVDGMNLRQLIQAKTLEPRQALELVTQICTALQFAHDEGVVHRDIKPENILLNKKGQVKIADFGLAKLLGAAPDTALTMSQAAMGTFNYMAPEQRENAQKVDHRADIYSLGVVFYEMLTGEVPMGRFEPPSKKVQIDVRLDEVVLHALEREPARRYQQASEVKSGVEAITSPGIAPAQPAANPPPFEAPSTTTIPSPPRISRAALLGVICLIVFVGVAGLSWAEFDLFNMPSYHFETPAGQEVNGMPKLGTDIVMDGPPKSWRIAVFTLGTLAVAALLGMTTCGWLAVTHIRRSSGSLYGLGLALFDGLFLPLLALDGVVTLFLASMVGFSPSMGGFYWGIGPLVSVALDYFIVRKVWSLCRQKSEN